MKKGESAVVDCVNIHPKDRIMWATVARQANPNCRLVLVHVDVDAETCIERARARKSHPTLSPENAEDVVKMFAKGFKYPKDYELGKMKYEAMFNTKEDEDVLVKVREMLKK